MSRPAQRHADCGARAARRWLDAVKWGFSFALHWDVVGNCVSLNGPLCTLTSSLSVRQIGPSFTIVIHKYFVLYITCSRRFAVCLCLLNHSFMLFQRLNEPSVSRGCSISLSPICTFILKSQCSGLSWLWRWTDTLTLCDLHCTNYLLDWPFG